MVTAGEQVAQRAGEEGGLVVGDQDVGTDGGQGDRRDPPVAPFGGGVDEAAEAVDHRGTVLRPGGGEDGEPAGLHLDARVGVAQDGGACRGGRAVGIGVRVEGEEAHHPGGGDKPAADVLSALDQELDGKDQHRHVPVDGDELAHRDVAVGGHPGGQPGDGGEEERGQSDAEGLQPAGDGADPVAVGLQLLRVPPVALGIGLLAAEAVEHPQPADHVLEPGGQSPLLLAVAGLHVAESADQWGDHSAHQRDADQHDGGEQRGDGKQQDRHGADRDQRADAGADEGEGSGDLAHVADADGDDLAGGDQPGQRRAEPDGLPDHDPDGAEAGIHPQPGHGPVAQHADSGVQQTGHQDERGPADHGARPSGLETVVDGA
ncbi:hypothetical protein GCM10025734_82970 [Kitasatospora paranensis]